MQRVHDWREARLHQGFSGKYAVPTAAYGNFAGEPALQYLEQCDLPVVIKASGLAAGKGAHL